MAYTTINKHTDYINTVLYTGTGSELAITGVGFQPDWTWIKRRDAVANGGMFDVLRGVTKLISSSQTDAEQTLAQSLKSFDSDGFTLGTGPNGYVNTSSSATVAWNWKAGGAGSANSDGSISSTVSVNTTAGFSIVKWTGTAANATVGHGLGAVPKMIIVKNLADSTNWNVYHQGVGNDGSLYLNSTQGKETYQPFWNNTTPTSSVFTVGSDGATNGSGDNMIAYCFVEKTGYSKFGTYYGNGAADGAFVYTGFRPQFTLIKPLATQNWQIHDTKRDGYNVKNDNLSPNNTAAEADNQFMDILSNGFKLRSSTYSASSTTYIYMAFGQSLVGSNNVPCTAR